MKAQERIYIVGIGGTGTGALAGLLKEAGHTVLGSDTALYPPMSDRLLAWGIDVHTGYDPAHLEAQPVDCYIIGNVIRRDNPQAVRLREMGARVMSMPEAVAHYGIGDRHSIVLAGTHGKTTTTALVAHLLKAAGKDPGYLIGGAPVGGGPSAHVGQGDYFVVEGDEYDTAYFDKGPKFLHYRARTAVITSLEFDHADIYANLAAIQASFARLIAQLPEEGTLVVWQGAHDALSLVAEHRPTGRTLTYAVTPSGPDQPDIFMASHHTAADGLHFEAVMEGRPLGPMRVPLWGDFSACNVLAALGAVRAAGLTAEQLRQGFASFPGVRRRMEVVAEVAGITLVDDFGHHPTAVRVTLAAARERWPGRRLWALFEPRSATSRRNDCEADYVTALGGADVAVVAHHVRLGEVPPEQRFSPTRVAAALMAQGTQAFAPATTEALVATMAEHVRQGDVLLVLSNGDFDGVLPKFAQALRAREP